MVARPAKPFRSANAGELSDDVKGRVDIQQYYSAGLQFRNIEPVPQSGWRQMGGTRRLGTWPAASRPRMCDILLDDGTAVMAIVTPGLVEFFTDAGKQGDVAVPAITAGMLSDLDFYAEGKTIGIFHRALKSVRLFNDGGPGAWTADDWPYAPPPDADLGGVYPMTADVWEIAIRWANNPTVVLNVTVDTETTPAVALTDAGGTRVPAEDATADWDLFAANLAAAINALSTVASGVTVSAAVREDNSNYLLVTFGGAATGREYQVSATVSNTADASGLAYHREIGKTQYEPLWSAGRGWPGHASLVQDRMAHGRIAAQPGAIAMSRTGEYFDFDVSGTTPDAARLDRLRAQTAETVLMLKESTFLLALTDRAVYFATNRVMERGQPLNFVLASEIGAQPNCPPFDLDGQIFYVAINPQGLAFAHLGGRQLYSMVYNDVSTKFDAAGESLLASHLVDRLIRAARQKPETDLDASKGWLLRTDGRLVAAQIIKNQKITGFCQWQAAGGGIVREIRVDGRNRLWLAVQRGALRTIELYDQALFLHDVVTKGATDFAGVLTGLDSHEGAEVWAVAQGYVLGPFTVAGGAIDLRDAYDGPIVVGRWQKPVFESMPEVLVRGNDDVLIRPGRIHTAHINIVGTTSIAVGANGTPPADVPLLDAGDPVDQAMPAKTKLVTVAGLDGWMTYPTLTITQVRPGPLRVKDYGLEAKL
ncbi:MAG: hypothetical protein KIS96_14470 [Bauldia sp.]|nr:hypothetical protein [Bauldia sp.]